MAVSSGPTPSILSDDSRSYLDWPAIFAGTILASAISFVLLTFGSAIGLSFTSAYEGSGTSLVAFSIAAALWLLWVQISSFFAGGYLAGRMRRRHGDASEHESDIRDGSGGLTVWALGVLVGAFIAVSGLSQAVSTATTSVGAIAGGAASALATTVDPTALAMDRLLRPAAQPEAPAGGTQPTPAADRADNGDTVRTGLGRVLMSSLADGALSEDDKAYVVSTVASETGVAQPEAEQRVTQFMEQARKVEADARAAAERARKIAMLVAFMTAASLFISGAAAYFGATVGGNHRDKQMVFVGWNRFS